MLADDPTAPIHVDCREGRGRVVGFTSRGRTKKIVAIVLIGRKFVDVPLGDLRAVRARKSGK